MDHVMAVRTKLADMLKRASILGNDGVVRHKYTLICRSAADMIYNSS